MPEKRIECIHRSPLGHINQSRNVGYQLLFRYHSSSLQQTAPIAPQSFSCVCMLDQCPVIASICDSRLRVFSDTQFFCPYVPMASWQCQGVNSPSLSQKQMGVGGPIPQLPHPSEGCVSHVVYQTSFSGFSSTCFSYRDLFDDVGSLAAPVSSLHFLTNTSWGQLCAKLLVQ